MTYSKMTGLAAVVAAAVGAVQTEGGTIRLNVAQTLAVIALLGWIRVNVPIVLVGRWDSGELLLSVVRGRGQLLDSCPRSTDQISCPGVCHTRRYLPGCLPVQLYQQRISNASP